MVSFTLPTDTSVWRHSLHIVQFTEQCRQERNLQCWKGAVDNKTAIQWAAGTFPVFLMSPDAATLKIMHVLKEAKCSGKMPCLLSEWLKYPSKTVSNHIQSAKKKQKGKFHVTQGKSIYLLQNTEVWSVSAVSVSQLWYSLVVWNIKAFNQIK